MNGIQHIQFLGLMREGNKRKLKTVRRALRRVCNHLRTRKALKSFKSFSRGPKIIQYVWASMDGRPKLKPKRRKQKKTRTQAPSSSSDSEDASGSELRQPLLDKSARAAMATSTKVRAMTDVDVCAAFSKYYMQRVAIEFAEDLDRVRGADDFSEGALFLLVNALQRSTSVFSIAEQRRVATAGIARKDN